ncbi:MAG: M24 family metallopeptidase [Planctomycetota bacterium]|jgi:Xaa-Pro aminopeptidase
MLELLLLPFLACSPIPLDRLVPTLMRERGVDLWILVAREYNEDPVLETMLPSTWMSARRRTILLFHDAGPELGVRRFAVSRYGVGEFFEAVWDPEAQPDQWARLGELVRELDPERIAIDTSSTFALADGLSHTEYEGLIGALGFEYVMRLVDAEGLAIQWLETRTPLEMELYPNVCALAHAIIAEGLSSKAIQPGHTTTADLQWWFRERIAAAGVDTWFHPSVSVQRPEGGDEREGFSNPAGVETIRRGDLVWVDLGIEYLGLNTDTQQHAYVLRAGEDAPPPGLVAGLAAGNRMQDILTSHFADGRSGNEVLALARAQAEAEGLVPSVYTHPLGLHGHGAGATIGLWDRQDGVPGRGDYPVRASTAWSIELNVTVPVPEWGGQTVRIMLEEDAFFDGEQVRYIDGRQRSLMLIR